MMHIFTLKLDLAAWKRGGGGRMGLSPPDYRLQEDEERPGSGEGTDPTLSHMMPQEQQCWVLTATAVSADPTQQLALGFWVLSHFGITPWHESCWVSPLPVICSEPGCRG